MYKGYIYDVETKLYYCNSRYYSPELRRFISPDSIDYLDFESINGLNLYVYCENNLVNYSEGSGYFPILCTLLFLRGLGALTSVLTTAGQMIYSRVEYSVDDYIINIGMSAAVGGLTSRALGKVTSGLSYFADTDFFLSNLVKFAGNYGGITLQNSVINQLMGQLIVRGVVTGTISNMFGSIFQEIPSKSSDYYHLRKMGLNPWDSFRYAFFRR